MKKIFNKFLIGFLFVLGVMLVFTNQADAGTVTVLANGQSSLTVSKGTEVEITWDASSWATSCPNSPDGTDATSGSYTYTADVNQTFTVYCYAPDAPAPICDVYYVPLQGSEYCDVWYWPCDFSKICIGSNGYPTTDSGTCAECPNVSSCPTDYTASCAGAYTLCEQTSCSSGGGDNCDPVTDPDHCIPTAKET